MTDADMFWANYTVVFAVDSEAGIELVLAPTIVGEANLALRLTDEGIRGRLDDLEVRLPLPIPSAVVDALMDAQPTTDEAFAAHLWRQS